MRYSLYIHLNNMINTLMEASSFIEQSEDTNLCKDISLTGKAVIKNIKISLLKNKDSILRLDIFDQLDKCEEHLDKLIKLIENRDKHNQYVSLLEDDIKNLQIIFNRDAGYKYSIVFFAELGQKWNAMNSVYQAFKERNDCEVKVVLTPIFREVKRSGKIHKDVIYDDYLTPMGIECVPYEKYDLSEELPDIAFICNPYESVTLPEFWPKNIAKYTKLVYLPYYMDRAIDNISVQINCKLPIASQAWKIIAQSEEIKKLHQKEAPKKGDNVLVAGLPKWDEIFDIIENPSNINTDWERKLKHKKVFLWNSHYDITSHTSTLLELGEGIINMFLHRNDIALIWRPHPMTETIFKLYLPHYTYLWEDLKNKVEISDNIILDNDSSYKNALFYSDALISDYSSLIGEYMLTRKPILWLQKSSDETYYDNIENLIPLNSLEKTSTIQGILRYVDFIVDENDLSNSIDFSLPTLDGKYGKRICDEIISQYSIDAYEQYKQN